jgi:hypothetical protein
VRIQIPAVLDQELHRKAKEQRRAELRGIPVLRLRMLSHGGYFEEMKALVVRHQEGDLTISTVVQAEEERAWQQVRLNPAHLGEGDRFEVISITRSKAGVYFTPMTIEGGIDSNETKELAELEKQVAHQGLPGQPAWNPKRQDRLEALRRRAETRHLARRPGNIVWQDAPVSYFGQVRACPNSNHMRTLSEFCGIEFGINQQALYSDYRAMPLGEFESVLQEFNDEIARARAQLSAAEMEGVDALVAIETTPAGYIVEDGEIQIINQKRVDEANAIAVAVRALQLAPADTVSQIASKVPAHYDMAVAQVEYDMAATAVGEQIRKETPSFAEMLRMRNWPHRTSERITAPSTPGFVETIREGKKVPLVTVEQHYPEVAEVPAMA